MEKPTAKKILLYGSLIGILMLVFYNTKDLFLGTAFSIKTVSDGTTISDSFLPISGNARHAASLEINGRVVAMDTAGNFFDGALLSPGYNIVEIKQKDRFGKEQTRVLHLVAQPSSAVATTLSVHYQ